MANGGGPFGIGDQILKGFIGTETLRDYTHASRTFTTNSYELKPRYKFLYHVSFTINTQRAKSPLMSLMLYSKTSLILMY